MSNPEIIERKSVDISGRLGSLYDTSTDRLIGESSVEASESTLPNKLLVCRVFSGGQPNDKINYLEQMDFDDALRSSILLAIVKASGVSSVINYERSANEKTFFLHYSFRSKEEKLNIIGGKAHQVVSVPSPSPYATHMITKIVWGFEILCVISILEDQDPNTVNGLLRSISTRLKKIENDFVLTDAEKSQLDQLKCVFIRSSDRFIQRSSESLSSALTNLKCWQKRKEDHHPLKYTMSSLRWLYNSNQFPEVCQVSYPINSDILCKIHNFKNWAEYFQRTSEALPEKLSSPTLHQTLQNAQQHVKNWLNVYEKLQKRLQETIVDVRRRRLEPIAVQALISDEQYSLLQGPKLEAFNQEIQQLVKKTKLIKRLEDDQIQYIYILDLHYHDKVPGKKKYIDRAIRRSCSKEDSSIHIMYGNDQWKEQSSTEWKQIYKDLLSKRHATVVNVILVYVDLTGWQCDIQSLSITSLPMSRSSNTRNDHPAEEPMRSTDPPPLHCPSKQLTSSTISEINVLLLGETGVGKSTFINAFVNYLVYDTLQQAEQSESVVLIPVAFLMTEGEQFNEVTVKFGNVDPNENYEHQGQSVTQQCKSYVFHLSDTLLLRLIDTPGIGDTRGLAQDEKNIAHILTYVNNLPHLNGVCLLLKPNTSQLDIFFRSCINQLLTYLTPVGYDNIIFCFTNARSTFYAPGDTGPLLRKMLKQENLDGVQFQKENTFCFDSESFRYLAAGKCNVNFDDFQKRECTTSWTTSVTESVRLLQFIQTRQPYYLNEWQSLQKVILEIAMLARPLMETLRLILYNILLCKVGSNDKEIIIKTNPVENIRCSHCAQFSILEVGPFYMLEYGSVRNESVQVCSCPFDENHFLLEYTVTHGLISQPNKRSINELTKYFDDVLLKCDRLTHFLWQKNLPQDDEVFTSVFFRRFSEEEKHIYNILGMEREMNKRMREELRTVKQSHQKNFSKLEKSDKQLSLHKINEIMEQLTSLPDVAKQLDCIKRSRQFIMAANEYQVAIPSNNNHKFTRLISHF